MVVVAVVVAVAVESSARGRDANAAYPYERIAEGDHEHAEQPDSPHVMRRGYRRAIGGPGLTVTASCAAKGGDSRTAACRRRRPAGRRGRRSAV